MKLRQIAYFLSLAALAQAEIRIPEGTRVRVLIDQNVYEAPSSEVTLSVAEPVEVGMGMAIPAGAKVHATLIKDPKADLVVDRVQLSDGSWIGLRTRLKGEAPRGVLAAGAKALREGTVLDLYTERVSISVEVPRLAVLEQSGEDAVRLAGHFVESGKNTSVKVFRDGYALMTAFGMGLVLLGGVYRWFGAARR